MNDMQRRIDAILAVWPVSRVPSAHLIHNMAKKATKSAPATPAETTPTQAAVPAEERGKNDHFARVFDAAGKAVAPNGKIPPQAQVILNTLEAAGKDGISRQDLVKSLTGVLVTRQPVGRIVSYYQKLIQSVGAAKVSAAAPAAS
jgi:hypothetical protein